MKTFKILFAAVIIAGFATSAMATDDDATAKADARVITAIDVTKFADLQFGQMFPNESKAVDLEGNTEHPLTEDVQAARFDVTASIGSALTLEYTTLPSTLAGPGGATIDITYVSGFGTSNDGTDTTALDVNDENSIDSPADLFYVFLGGTVTSGEGQAPGVYQADITLTATYN